MAMHLRLGLAELAGERSQPHRLSGRGQRLDDLPGDHDGLNELGIARALLILGTIQRVGFHARGSFMQAPFPWKYLWGAPTNPALQDGGFRRFCALDTRSLPPILISL